MSRPKKSIAIDDLAPSNAAYLNLSNYMYYAYSMSYAKTDLQSNIGFKPLTVNGRIVKSVVEPDGFYGEAFVSVNTNGAVTKNSQIVVAYEGTNLLNQSNALTGGQILDDSAIIAGTQAPSYKDAAAFAKQVIGDAKGLGIKKTHVTLTGHSLGGANAEYAAKATGLGGVTFAAPGIGGKAQSPASLTNYLDEADPLGNYGNQSSSGGVPVSMWGKAVTLSPSIHQYGTVREISDGTQNEMNALNALNLGALIYNQSTNASDKEAGLAFGLLSTLQSDKINVNGNEIQGFGFFHGLTQYANDLHEKLYLPDATCFAAGTRIRIVREGEHLAIAVENLIVGDLAVTSTGALRPIRWLGHRTMSCARHADPALVRPIRIASHAFGPDRPERDLVVSPGHGICVEAMGEVLIPAGALINGSTIVQLDVATVTYWHVELETHDILLAENLPTESYLEMGNRSFFAESDVMALHARPDASVATHADFCRPYVAAGPRVGVVRMQLEARAARLSISSRAAFAIA